MNPLQNDLAARIGNQGLKVIDPRPIRQPSSPPRIDVAIWRCVGKLGGTFTPGTDWKSEFLDPTVTQWEWSQLTVHGELDFLIRDNPGSQGGRMAEIDFDVERSFDVVCDLRVTAGRVQIINNGAAAEYTVSTQISLSFSPGPVQLAIIGNSASGDILFRARLMDGAQARWRSA